MTTTTRMRGVALVGVIALAGGLAWSVPALAADPVVKDDPIRLDIGHIDAFNLVLKDDKTIRLVLKEDATGSHVLRTPESVELAIKSAAYSKNLPAAGIPAGAPTNLYLLPLVQDTDLIWPGWDSQGIGSEYGPQAKVDIDVSKVDGPGDVYLWTSGTLEGTSQLLKDTWKFPGVIHQDFLAHVHANWGFTAPGTYKFTAKASVKSADGTKTSTSNEATYTFVVTPAPTAVKVAGAEKEVEPGSEVTLTSALEPAGADFKTYAWSTRTSETAPWQNVEGGNAQTLKVKAVPGTQYRVSVSGGKDYASGSAKPIVLESDPVTIKTKKADIEQKLVIGKLADKYTSGADIELAVTADPAVTDGKYRWFMQRTDQPKPVAIAGANGATHKLTAEQALNGAKVTAELLGEGDKVLATASAVTINVDDAGAQPLQKVTISGLAENYREGDTVKLVAKVAPSSVLDRFEWYVKKTSSAAPERIIGQEKAEYSFPMTKDLADATLFATLVYDNSHTYTRSEPVTLKLNSDIDIPETKLTISTDRAPDSYLVGQTATLTAKQETATGLTTYKWYTKKSGSDAFVVVEGATGAEYKFTPTLADSGMQVKVELLNGDKVHAASDPVTLTISQPDPATTLKVSADKESYEPGQTAHLTATQDPATKHTHYQWYTKSASGTGYEMVKDANKKDLDLPLKATDNGTQVMVRLYDDAGTQVAESAPVALTVKEKEVVSDKPEKAPEPKTPADFETVPAGGISLSSAAVTAGQPVTVHVGKGAEHAGKWVAAWLFSDPVLLGGDWMKVNADGTITATVPAGTPAGEHRVAVFNAAGDLVGWANLAVTAGADPGTGTDEGKPDGTLPVTGIDSPLKTVGFAAMFLLTGAGLVMFAKRRRTQTETR